jgi:hypothetical protein
LAVAANLVAGMVGSITYEVVVSVQVCMVLLVAFVQLQFEKQ